MKHNPAKKCICIKDTTEPNTRNAKPSAKEVEVKVGEVFDYMWEDGPSDWDGTCLSRYRILKDGKVVLMGNSTYFYSYFEELDIHRNKAIDKIIK